MAVQTQIQVRRGTAATWTSTNPTLAAGEWGLETDTGKYKVGTGSAVWTSLAYASILPSTVTTKGDLLAATGNAAVTRLAVGSDGYQLVADSSQSTGLGWAGNVAAGKNAIINGGFDIWQRGTTFTNANGSGLFAADRWQIYSGASGRTYSRQATNDTTNLPNIQYCVRVARDSGNTATNQLNMAQNFETVNSIPFAGKTVTLSFYARAGANYSATSNALNVKLQTGTGTDQNGFYSGYTGSASPIDTNVTLTTTWQRFSVTGTIAATATELLTGFYFTPTGTAGANDYYEVTGVQLELGSSATPFSRAGGNIQGELAACQRYYYRQTSVSSYGWMAYGGCQNTTNGQAGLVLPVQMRVVPTALEYGNVRVVDSSYSGTLTTLALNTGESTPNLADIYVTATGLTGGRPLYIGANNNTGAYLAVTAEL